MRTKTGLLICSALTAALTACDAAPERRWSEVRFVSAPAPAGLAPTVALSSYSTPDGAGAAAKTAPATDKASPIRKLSDPVQVALIDDFQKLLALDPPDCGAAGKLPCRSQALLEQLGMASGKGGDDDAQPSSNLVDATVFKRIIVINVLNGEQMPPGDRLQQFTLTAQPKTDDVRFLDYTIAQTQTSNANLGTITETTQFNIAGKVDPSLGGAVKSSGELSSGYSGNKVISAAISDTLVPLNVNVQDHTLFVQKRGNPVTDITGNILVTLSVKLHTDLAHEVMVVSRQNLYKNGKELPAANASIHADLTLFAPDDKDVTTDVSLRYLLRHIEQGAETYTEGDDSVTLYGDTVKTEAVLIPKDQIVGEKWMIRIVRSEPRKVSPGFEMYVPVECGELRATPFFFGDHYSQPLYFPDVSSATSFANWLNKTQSTDINAHQLIFKVDGIPLNWGDGHIYAQVVERNLWEEKEKNFCLSHPISIRIHSN